nr:cellulase family glycosylhydrolase [Allomuricauda sp.]
MKKLIITTGILTFLVLSCKETKPKETKTVEAEIISDRTVWDSTQAHKWYAEQEWMVGANYNPRSAINQLEMWQAETFDLEMIDEELGWASEIGMNVMRVYLHDLLHKSDSIGLYKRMDDYLGVADKHGIKTLFVFFDSCWNDEPKLGKQPEPLPHRHNSGWVESPGHTALRDSTQYPRYERFIKGTITKFREDERVLGWDLWNEPDNGKWKVSPDSIARSKTSYVIPLLEKSFEWARSVDPKQPLTSGIWGGGDWSSHEVLEPLQKLQLEQSDIITFHHYSNPEDFEKRIIELKRYNKPLICTEYMARTAGSTFQSHLPLGKKHQIGMINWGLVDGKTQTKYPWKSNREKFTKEPDVWFHEVFRADGTPYDPEETKLIEQLTGL